MRKDFSTFSDKQVQELFHHLCEARLIMEQDSDLQEIVSKNEDREYAELYWQLCYIESKVFSEHLVRERNNMNVELL